jgi:hypothetical protein
MEELVVKPSVSYTSTCKKADGVGLMTINTH